MFRRSLATGGDVLNWVWRRPVRRPRQLIVICDISGSMERHARVLLRFSQALAASAVRTEAFVFGTRLTRVTRLLRDRDRDRALTRVSLTVSDWSGGTRIGEVVPDVQPPLGAACPAQQRRRGRGQRRLGPGRPGARRDRDGPPPAELPPADLAQSAGQRAGLPAAGRGDVRGPAVHRRLRPGRARSPACSAWASCCPTRRPGARPTAARAPAAQAASRRSAGPARVGLSRAHPGRPGSSASGPRCAG